MGSKMKETSRTSSTSEIPGFAKGYINRVSGAAEKILDTPYEGYGGDRVAEFSPDTQRSFGMTRALAGSGIQGLPAAQQATARGMGQAGYVAARNLGGGPQFSQEALQQYMSPYMQNVVGQQAQEARRQFGISQAGRDAQAVRAGAFGGSRQAVQQSLAEEALQRQMGDIAAKGYQSAYESALGARESDLANQRAAQGLALQGIGQASTQAQQLAQLGGMAREADIQGAQLLAGIGATQEARDQALLDVAYQDFLEQRGYPAQQLRDYTSIMGGAYGSVPMNTTQAASSLQPGVGRQILGLGLGALGTVGGAMVGGKTGARLGMQLGSQMGSQVAGFAEGGIVQGYNR